MVVRLCTVKNSRNWSTKNNWCNCLQNSHANVFLKDTRADVPMCRIFMELVIVTPIGVGGRGGGGQVGPPNNPNFPSISM